MSVRIKSETPTSKFKNTIARSHEGMAHFAATGPAGKYCADCGFWRGYIKPSSGHTMDGQCAKFQLMTGTRGLNIPGAAASCKYFVENGGA